MRLQNLLMLLAMLTASVSCQDQGKDVPTSIKGPQFASVDPMPEAAQTSRPMINQMNNFNWLVQNSPFIFVGRVSGTKAEKDTKGLLITRNKFAVEKVIIGDSKTQVVVLTTLGGTVGEDSMRVSNMPEFVINQTYVVFTDLKRTVYNPITGNHYGVFVVHDDAIYTYDGRGLVDIKDGLVQTSNMVLESPIQRKNHEEAALVVNNPKISGSIVSIEEVDVSKVGAEEPMQLDAFIKVILTVADITSSQRGKYP
jgi:hypothetical protein